MNKVSVHLLVAGLVGVSVSFENLDFSESSYNTKKEFNVLITAKTDSVSSSRG